MSVMAMMIVVRGGPLPATAAHGHAALGAELRTFCLHAGRGPGHVGDRVAAEPHRIGRAGLPNVDLAGRTLGGGLADGEAEECGNWQCPPANDEDDPHRSFPVLRDNTRCARKLAAARRPVDGLAAKFLLPGLASESFSFRRARQNRG